MVDETLPSGQSSLDHCIAHEFSWAENHVGLRKLSIHARKHPARNRHSVSRTPNVTLALPVAVVIGRVTILAINHFECANPFTLFEGFGCIPHDGLNNVAFREGLLQK